MFPLKNTEAYIHANGFRSTLGKELSDRDAAISELGSEIQALTNQLNTSINDLGAKNSLPLSVAKIKALNTDGTWSGDAYTWNGITYTIQTDSAGNVTGIDADGTASARGWLYLYDGDLNTGGVNVDFYYEPTLNGYTYTQGSGAFEAANLTTFYNNSSKKTYILIDNAKVLDHVSFKPMRRPAGIADDTFAPYAKTNVELTQDVADATITCEVGANVTSLRANVIRQGNLVIGNFFFEGACTSSDAILTVPAGNRPANGQYVQGIITVGGNIGYGYYRLDADGRLRQTSTSSAASAGCGSFAYYIGQL